MNNEEFEKIKSVVEVLLKPVEQRLDHADRVRGFNYNRAALIVSIVSLLTSIGMAAILLIMLIE